MSCLNSLLLLLLLLLALVYRLLYGYQTRTLAAASFQIGFFSLLLPFFSFSYCVSVDDRNVLNHCGSIAPDHRSYTYT